MAEQNSEQNKRIRVRCESCGNEYRLSPDNMGRKAKCGCGHIFVVAGSGKDKKDERKLKEARQAPASVNEKVILPFGPWLDIAGIALVGLILIMAFFVPASLEEFVQRHTGFAAFLVVSYCFFAAWMYFDIKRLRSMGAKIGKNGPIIWVACFLAAFAVACGVIPTYLILRRIRWKRQILAAVQERMAQESGAHGQTVVETWPKEKEVPKISGLAIGSLVSGILLLPTAGLTVIPGLILGIIGLRQIRRSCGAIKGKGIAVTGVVLSSIGSVLVLLVIILTSISLSRERRKSLNTSPVRIQLLFEAVEKGQRQGIEDFVAKGGNLNTKNKEGLTALHVAVLNRQEAIVELLIASGADVNAKDVSGETPLRYALDENLEDIADILRKRGAKE